MSFETKDSGVRENFASGMVRDTQDNKPRYDLLDRPMLTRWAELMARGAKKYGEENWRKAMGEAELRRFKASAFRHLMQWLDSESDEDHAAAILFNVAGAEMVKEKLKNDLSKASGTPTMVSAADSMLSTSSNGRCNCGDTNCIF